MTDLAPGTRILRALALASAFTISACFVLREQDRANPRQPEPSASWSPAAGDLIYDAEGTAFVFAPDDQAPLPRSSDGHDAFLFSSKSLAPDLDPAYLPSSKVVAIEDPAFLLGTKSAAIEPLEVTPDEVYLSTSKSLHLSSSEAPKAPEARRAESPREERTRLELELTRLEERAQQLRRRLEELEASPRAPR